MTAVEHKTCRSCGSTSLTEVLSLGEQYVSDFLLKLPELGDPFPEKVPIILDLCGSCTLVQQRYTAPQDLLYSRHYWYRSGVTDTMREALKDVVRCAVDRIGGLRAGDVVLDIGSNDGTLLRHYDSYSPERVVRVGVEPADNLATAENYADRGLELIHDFWPSSSGGTVLPYDKARIITACGMFYDLEDPNLFLKEVARVLHSDGVFVAQLQCLKQTVELGDVGNFCHEHLEFYSLQSLILLLGRCGLGVVDVEENSVNGGSYRVYCRHLVDGLEFSDRVTDVLAEENRLGLADPATYLALYRRMADNRDLCVDFLLKEKARGKRIWVYGASTKGNVILQWYGLDGEVVEAAADRSPEKWGRYTVGTGIPIASEECFRQSAPDYALVLPYTFRDEFLAREKEWRSRGGKFVFPLPEFEVV